MSAEIKDRTILLVEDDENAQIVHTYFLKKMGFQMDLATTGKAALQRIQEKHYFAVILDLGLPDMPGQDVLESIRNQEKRTGTHLPVIVVTAHGDTQIISECRDKKADVSFTKPVTFPVLKVVLDKLLHLKS